MIRICPFLACVPSRIPRQFAQRRASLIRLSIIAAASGLLLGSILIVALFLSAVMNWHSSLLISGLFICAMLSLMVSLVAFIKEVQLSLGALRLELGYTAADCRETSEPQKLGVTVTAPAV